MKPVMPALVLLAVALAGCVAPVGPVEVVRFHRAGAGPLAPATIMVAPAPGMDGASLEWRSYAAAVGQELQRLGYVETAAATSAQVAIVGLAREASPSGATDRPVTVGIGAGTDGHAAGVGLGIGIGLSGPAPAQVVTRLSVSIRDRASQQVVWEGRASFTVRASSPMAGTQLGAPRLAQALFRDFPGRSGETVLVR